MWMLTGQIKLEPQRKCLGRGASLVRERVAMGPQATKPNDQCERPDEISTCESSHSRQPPLQKELQLIRQFAMFLTSKDVRNAAAALSRDTTTSATNEPSCRFLVFSSRSVPCASSPIAVSTRVLHSLLWGCRALCRACVSVLPGPDIFSDAHSSRAHGTPRCGALGTEKVVGEDLVTNIFLPMSGSDHNCGSSSKNSMSRYARTLDCWFSTPPSQ